MRRIVGGIDLSLTGLAIVAVPVDWRLDWARVRSVSLGYPLTKQATTLERIIRMTELARDAASWVQWAGCTHVWIEGGVVSGRAFNIDKLFMLCGIVQAELYRSSGMVAEVAPQSSARKLFLGKLPRRDRKKVVSASLKSMTDVFADDDQRDAFVVANWGLSEMGFPAVMAAA